MACTIIFLFLLIGVYGQDSSDSANNFAYPCESLDLDCIRDYFSHTGCREVSYEDGESIQKEMNVAYMPRLNGTLISTDVEVKFYGSTITKFYVNKDTNNLVLSINFEGMNINSPHGNLRINQRGREPVYAEDKVNATYYPVVANFYAALLDDIPTEVQELLLTKAPYFFYVYFQNYICDYGIEYTGEYPL
ncbi:uncharacterized protein LOC114359357 isoform X2 [Ostrinia furnacalis]|uniref:uncharacterized protein LOC114359357 isoform X2 n=1 Tax=Ostrinia furnacalis TaxID=93504 RepID=UPI001038AC2E|nr:uncharacterized protein LOC114359357 isoform X2 [Ostrinia furnacalis]